MGEREGGLSKQSGVLKGWKRKTYAIKDGAFVCWKVKTKVKVLGPLKSIKSVGVCAETKKAHTFTIVFDNGKTITLAADNDVDRDAWIRDLQQRPGGSASPSTPGKAAQSSPAVPPSGSHTTVSGEEPSAFAKPSIDDFDMLALIGQGSYGKVHLVRFKRTGELFALKTMSKRLLQDTETVEHRGANSFRVLS
jgi:hypothetical protein